MKKMALAIPAAGIALLAMAGCSSSSSTPGPETFAGSVSGKAAVAKTVKMPLTWSGPVAATSTFVLTPPAKGQKRTFVTSAGKMVAEVTAKPVNSTTGPGKDCLVRQVTTVSFKVLGSESTGKFAGDAGTGKVVVEFQGDLPKLGSGKCDMSQNAEPVTATAVTTFDGYTSLSK